MVGIVNNSKKLSFLTSRSLEFRAILDNSFIMTSVNSTLGIFHKNNNVVMLTLFRT